MNAIDYNNFAEIVLESFPELRSAYEEETRLAGGKPSNYALSGSLIIPLIDQALQSKDQALIERLFDFIERLATSPDIDVVNLAQTDICEYLGGTDERYHASRPHMRPATRLLSDDVENRLHLPHD
jgi:hypothetical protein